MTIISRQVNVTRDHTQSGTELTALLNDGRATTTLGVTTIQMGYTHEIHMPADPCKGPSVYVNLSTRTAAIAIASELSPEDCYFHEVVEHEMKHAESAQRAVDDASVALDRRLVTALKAAAASTTFPDKETAYSTYARIVEAEVQAAIRAGTEQFSREGALIDSKEEVARFNAACSQPILAARHENSPAYRRIR